MGDSQEEISDKEYRVQLLLKRRFYCFQLKKRLFIAEHMNNYTKLLTNLVNVDVYIEEENKTLILLNSLPDEEYESFVLTLINRKQSLNYNNVSVALINYEVGRKDKQSSFSSTLAEALVVRGKGSNQKGKGIDRRSKSRPQRSKQESVCLLQRNRTLEG